jgi:hypothetical protein
MGIKTTLNHALKAQAAIILANWAFTYVSLVLQKPDYERVKADGEGSGKKPAGEAGKGGKAESDGKEKDPKKVVVDAAPRSSKPGGASTAPKAKVPLLPKGGFGGGGFSPLR